ncbi:transglutaminase [Flavobacterium sp. KMS]|jgi:transglutaminase/protease-like cytokinesis protein 3|uniref:transglutaminase domain-containing protein n=1 Tax=Flavobacterium sp. KMS TaxID=1566023 RepID=UPI00057F3DF4|nr:transglutaminase domain-containing protein [Flavobacterium sp. KMS]KIA98855.1 transglutaminase [Flavobacterium sp. KMS]
MTIKKIAFIFLFLNYIFLYSAYSQKYNAIDDIVRKYPKHFSSTEDLATRIQKDFTSEYDKARAIYSWIALNIKYDYKAYLNPQKPVQFSYRTEAEKQKQIELIKEKTWQKAFDSQKAVCEGFTLLYQRLASLVDLKSQVIRGDSKQSLTDIGRKNLLTNHSWNIVWVDGKWILVDVTWGQGYYDSNRKVMVNYFNSVYFDTDPKYFFAKHFPDSGMYLDRKLNQEDFLNGPLISDKAIEEDLEILRPESGIIKANDGDKISFKIKNISKSDTFFYLKRGQPVKVENPKEVRGTLEFQITYDKKTGSFITFFLYQNSVASFKIIPK